MAKYTKRQLDRYLQVIKASRSALQRKTTPSSQDSTVELKYKSTTHKASQVVLRAIAAVYNEKRSIALSLSDPKETAAPQHNKNLAEKAQLIVTKTIRTYTKWSSEKLAEAEDDLRPYEGLPVQFDLISLMGLSGNEAVFCRLLAWLLTPEESHDLGDSFLRLFLAHLGISGHGNLFDFTKPLKAEVATEVSWDVPKGETFLTEESADQSRADGNVRRLRVDILLVIQGFVIPIEAKIYAKESLYQFRGERWAQAALYGKMWQLMLHASTIAKSNESSGNQHLINWNLTLKRCVEANSGLYDKLYLLDNGRAEVVPVLIHPTGLCRTANQQVGAREHEQRMSVWHMSWLDIDRMLYRLCRDRDLQSGRLDLIRSFRTTILSIGSRSNLVSRIEDLRLRMAEPALTRRFPIQSASTLKTALFDLKERDKCCAVETEIMPKWGTPNE